MLDHVKPPNLMWNMKVFLSAIYKYLDIYSVSSLKALDIIAIYLYILDEVTRILQQTWWGIIFGRAAASGEEMGYCWHCRGGGGVKLQEDTSMEPSLWPSSGGWVKLLAPASSLLPVSVHKGWKKELVRRVNIVVFIFSPELSLNPREQSFQPPIGYNFLGKLS